MATGLCECGRPVHSVGMCGTCYQRRRRGHQTRRHTTDGDIDTSGERCRCGLRLPCNECLPTNIIDHIESRMAKQSNWPEAS